jgi:hypothetical protein
MGCMRSSNCEDGLNFHFLMIVQRTATPATLEATTMRMVTVVCFPALLEAADEGVAEATAAVLVTRTAEMVGCPTVVRTGMGLAVGGGGAEEVALETELDEFEECVDDKLPVADPTTLLAEPGYR